MILLIFGICILMAIIGSIRYNKFHTDVIWNVATFGLILSVCFSKSSESGVMANISPILNPHQKSTSKA